jgi:hypothetical protein
MTVPQFTVKLSLLWHVDEARPNCYALLDFSKGIKAMNEQESSPQDKDTPPYLSGTTFYNFIEAHRRTQPTRIDRSIMSNVAGGDQPRILQALRFFKLIDDDGIPTNAFVEIEKLESQELQAAWQKLLRTAYPYLFSNFKLEKATQSQLEEKFREQGIKGDTIRKAVTFFVTLGKLSGLELSPYFKAVRGRGPRPSRPRKTVSSGRPKTTVEEAPPRSQGPEGSYVAATAFLSGGVMAELRVSGNAFALSPSDREALFDWIDKIKGHKMNSGSENTAPASQPVDPFTVERR